MNHYLNTVLISGLQRSVWALLFIGICPAVILAQTKPLKIAAPAQDSSVVHTSVTYFRGLADPSAFLLLGGEEVSIYSTGVFAAPVYLLPGRNELEVLYGSDADTVRRILVIYYELPERPKPTEGFAIEYVKVLPGDEVWLQSGDHLQVEMKATPGMKAAFYNGIPMYEVDTVTAAVAGIYRGEYVVKASDSLWQAPITFDLLDEATQKTVSQKSAQQVTFLTNRPTLIGTTTGSRVALSYGLGTDRLGGAKMGYLDSLVRLEVTGKMQGMYRVRLSDQTQAYVAQSDLRLLEGVQFRPYSLTGSWTVRTDSVYDYVSIGMGQRLPYVSVQQQDPARIVVDVYGAVSNSNWITQREGLLAIRNVWYEQVAKDVFRVFIELKDPQHWGYEIGYQGRSLTIKVKPKPQRLALRHLTIAVDAGHGGSNRGAVGMTGVLEKELNLSMAMKLRHLLERKGATVVMTRDGDQNINNTERLKRLQAVNPDLLISIHCNAASNPMMQGASTYYRHQAYRPLSQYIYAEMLALGLADFGNVGGFNFALNSPTEYPSVLVEVAFMTNPADEERLLDPAFHDEMAACIMRGVENFLRSVR